MKIFDPIPQNHFQRLLTWTFLILEAVLYTLILTCSGKLLVCSSYIAIVLCFLYALSGVKNGSSLLTAGLFCTVLADFCLVVCDPIQQLWGMIFFLTAQMLYALHLQRTLPNKIRFAIRLTLIVISQFLCVMVLQDKTDLLALVSVCYYANLVMNIVDAIAQRKCNKLLPAAFLLFILCDTVIGLQVASGGYFVIDTQTLLYNILFVNFNLSWLFYLPSQILLALSARRK